MADQRQALTDKSIALLCAGEKQYKVRDSELPGFFVLSGNLARYSITPILAATPAAARRAGGRGDGTPTARRRARR